MTVSFPVLDLLTPPRLYTLADRIDFSGFETFEIGEAEMDDLKDYLKNYGPILLDYAREIDGPNLVRYSSKNLPGSLMAMPTGEIYYIDEKNPFPGSGMNLKSHCKALELFSGSHFVFTWAPKMIIDKMRVCSESEVFPNVECSGEIEAFNPYEEIVPFYFAFSELYDGDLKQKIGALPRLNERVDLVYKMIDLAKKMAATSYLDYKPEHFVYKVRDPSKTDLKLVDANFFGIKRGSIGYLPPEWAVWMSQGVEVETSEAFEETRYREWSLGITLLEVLSNKCINSLTGQTPLPSVTNKISRYRGKIYDSMIAKLTQEEVDFDIADLRLRVIEEGFFSPTVNRLAVELIDQVHQAFLQIDYTQRRSIKDLELPTRQ